MTQDVSPGCTGPHVNAIAIIPGQPDLSWGWLPRVANGPFQSWKYPRIASWGIFSRPCGTGSFLEPLPRTHVLGYSQPSLRDWVVSRTSIQDSRPGLLSRPCGTGSFLEPLPRT